MSRKNYENRSINERKRRENMEKRKNGNNRKTKNPKSQKRSAAGTAALILAVGVFVFSGYQLFSIFSEYSKGEKEYTGIQKLVVKETDVEGKPEEESKFVVDFKALQDINPDVAGWIRFEKEVDISYPVVQGKDNEEYLTRTFEANDNKLGTLFADVNNHWDFSDKNTFIYGHNMKNGTMFAHLMKYKDKKFYDKNPYFYIHMPDGKVVKYQVCSAAVIKDTSELYNLSFTQPEEWQAYIDLMLKTASYDTGAVVTADSQIVSLSTCTNVTDEERFLVQGVKIGEE